MEKEVKLTISFSREKVSYTKGFYHSLHAPVVKEENIGFIKMNDIVIFKKSVYSLNEQEAEEYLIESFGKHIEPYTPINIIT